MSDGCFGEWGSKDEIIDEDLAAFKLLMELARKNGISLNLDFCEPSQDWEITLRFPDGNDVYLKKTMLRSAANRIRSYVVRDATSEHGHDLP